MTSPPKGGPPRHGFFRRLWLSLSLQRAIAGATFVPQERVFALSCFAPDAIALLRATFRRAEANGASRATLRQLVVEALALPTLRACIEAAGLDREVIVDAVAAPLGDPADEPSHDIVAHRDVWSACLLSCAMHDGGAAKISAAQLVILALTKPDLRDDFESFGLPIDGMKRFFAHGVLEHTLIDDDAHPRAETLAVAVDNDDFTPQDFVAAVLHEELALADQEAIAIMWRVHTEGTAVAATLPRHDAIAAANRVLARARDEGHPLRVRVMTLITR